MEADEKQLITAKTHVYGRRWWILAVFCLTCSTQAMIWNTWGPVAESSEIVLSWTDGNLAMVANLANISYMILVFPMCLLMDTKGLRFSMILCTAMLMLGAVIRVFSLDSSTAKTTAYICGFIQGIASTIPFSGPPLVSAIWFPPRERPTATAIGSFFNYLGVSLSFILGPQLVPNPMFQENEFNSTDLSGPNSNVTDYINNTTITNIESLRQGILSLLYIHSALAALVFILTVAYFPATPPRPPSKTASIQRTDYKQALKDILHNGPLWLIVLAGGIPIGVTGVWIALLDVVVKPLGVTQVDAGWMGFWHTTIGCFTGIIIAMFADVFHRRRKMFLVILFTCAMICSIWFALLCNSILDFDLKALYASSILLGIFINGTTPLFYELSAEASYPVAEGVTGGFYTSIDNVAGIIFLSLVSVPNIGTEWMNWAVLGSLVLAIPLLFIFPERYNRTDTDLYCSVEKTF